MANKQNLEKIHEAINKAIDVATVKAEDALKSGKISESEWQKAKDKWGKLEIKQSEINGIIIDKEFHKKLLNNNLESRISKIEQATNSLNKSAGKIDDFNNCFSEIENALQIASGTIKAISPIV
ncbi:MAG: hypothetical protein V7L04_09255 [Nostoc sp.]|uniref:hypothetical protein n=1 Tax=Nostoc sp. TaxID=1180 RepID=UPI002FFAA3B0